MNETDAERIPYKLVVISDTHHDMVRLERMIPVINSADYLVFCGDGVMDIMKIRGMLTVPIVCVKGNNDLGANVNITETASVAFGSTRAIVTHGHKYGVYQGLRNLYGLATMHGARLVFFGHTHTYCDRVEGGVHFINPGALCSGSYALVAGDGENFIARRGVI